MIPENINRYEIKSEIGRGGMATVYRAYDPRFERDVAVKVLPRQFLHELAFRRRFEREAKTIAALEHTAIVPVYDYGEENEQLYLVMRYMPGGSLSERLKEGPLPIGEAARILQHVGEGLDQAHKRGVIHRDLKPGNILFDQYGDAYLSDFGIVKVMEAGGSLTGTGIVGTPAYMSPEQARGEKNIDGRSDVYALGVILFEMLAGQAPYDADTPMGLAVKHILDPIPDILTINPDLPPELDQVIMRALAKDPDDRYQTACELAEALETVARGEPLPEALAAPAEPKPQPAGPPPSKATQEVQVETPSTHVLPEPAPATAVAVETVKTPPKREMQPRRRGVPTWIVLGLIAFCFFITFSRLCGGATQLASVLEGSVPRIGKGDEAGVEVVTNQVEQELGDVEALEITLEVGALDGEIYALSGSRYAAQGEYMASEGLKLGIDYETRGSTGVLTVKQHIEDFTLFGNMENFKNRLELGLTDAVPINLTVNTGAGAMTLDLTGIQLRSLSVSGGAGSLVIILPAEGDFNVQVTSGVGSVTIRIPTALEGRIEFGGALVNLTVPDRFSEIADNRWQTDNYGSAADRVLLKVDSALGNVEITDLETTD